MLKTCSRCFISKPKNEFYSSVTSADGLQSRCVECCKLSAREWSLANQDKVIASRKKHCKPQRIFKTRQELLAAKRVMETARYKSDPQPMKDRVAAWKKANPHRVAAMNALRKALVRRAVPGWANLQKIDAVYASCIAITKASGIKHHVDHTVPIVHELVCGLHTEDNLQVLTATQNCSKQNLWWPDCPDDCYRAKERLGVA